MWQTELNVSKRQLVLFLLFYVCLAVILFIQLWQTRWRYSVILVGIIIVYEAYRCYCRCLLIHGAFAIISMEKQIFWQKQRWFLCRPPLFLHYGIILNLKSLRKGKRVTLFLFYDHVDRQGWRTLNYLMHRLAHEMR